MRARTLLTLLLGLWLGASLAVTAVIAYNLGGFGDLFARNPALAERAGFDPADAAAKKSSLPWVHASELNRVFIGAWNRVQLLLAALTLAAAFAALGQDRREGRRPRWVTINLVAAALVLVVALHLALEPQLVELGRALDFQTRDPPPAGLAEFQRLHGLYFAADLLRLALVGAATAWVLVRAGRRP